MGKINKTINGMYGFSETVLDLMIQSFNTTLSESGIERLIEDGWKYVHESEDGWSQKRYEIAAWALERAITLRDRG